MNVTGRLGLTTASPHRTEWLQITSGTAAALEVGRYAQNRTGFVLFCVFVYVRLT
jgi:hypothetical protein